MRILHLISSGGMYGAEAVILNLSAALNSGGESRSLLGVFENSAAPNRQLHEAALAAGIESTLIPCHGQLDRNVPARIRSLAQDSHAHVIHAHGYKADIYAYIALRKAGLPLVSTCHNWLDTDQTVRLYGAIDRWTLRRFDGVVAVSPAVRDRLLGSGVNPTRIRLIRNGVNMQSFAEAQKTREHRPKTHPGLRIGIVARLSPEKGVDIFLRAAAEVLRQRSDTQFLVAGDGPDLAELTALIASLGIERNATLLGHTTGMPGFYSSIDLLVLASRTEGLPIALLEGMASGLPVVATSVGAVPQVIREGETGLLVPPNNPSALAEAILRLTDDASLRQSFGHAAQQLVASEFSADRMAADYLDLYRSVVAERNGRIACGCGSV
jgi:glycosyltransferase involved in cell wall biosynthesis